MTVVVADPAGFAVDWDWQRGLTVWTLQDPPSEPHFGHRVLKYQLPARPASESRARRAARRWWRTQGRSQVVSQAGPAPGGPTGTAGP